MRHTLLIIVALMVAMTTFAAPVSKEKTHRIATNFFREMGGGDSLMEVNTHFQNLRIYAGSEGVGFVIMSSNDAAMPLLGYSVNNRFSTEDMPVNAEEWLQSYDDQIAYIVANNVESTKKIRNEWRRYEGMSGARMQRMPAQTSGTTANLLSTTWAQGSYYNEMCPYDSTQSAHAKTGCVALAMGQIMKYWGFPANGVGSHSYTDATFGVQNADFSTANYDYANMPNALGSSSTATEVNAVAKLIYHCGVAVEMVYRVSSSSSYTTGTNTVGYPSAENAYREYFKFMHSLHTVSIDDYTDSAWVALLKSEIDSGRPMQYSAGNVVTGGGHSFICCGYDNTGMFYFNWGWGGSSDGYYAIGALNPSTRQYQDRNKAIIGIRPDTTGSMTTVINITRNIPNAGTETGAGSYTSYQDTVTINAAANAGYLFDNWDGSNNYIEYQFIANGGNVTHTANYSLLKGDSLGYCYAGNQLAYGSNTAYTWYWGIRLDTVSLTRNRLLDRVRFFSADPGQYQVHIYKGGMKKPTTELLVDTISTVEDYGWVSVTLSQAVRVDTTQPLWIVMESNEHEFPMTYSSYRGNADGAWMTSNPNKSSWTNYVTDYDTYLAWQVEGLFTENFGPYVFEVTANNDQWGTVTGSGTYNEGTSAVITATANAGYEFVQWSDGNRDSVRTIIVDCDGWYEAIFQPIPSGVEDVVAGYVVAAEDGMIMVQGAEGEMIRVYDAQGKVVGLKEGAASIERFEVSAGVYFVRVNGRTMKVVVK